MIFSKTAWAGFSEAFVGENCPSKRQKVSVCLWFHLQPLAGIVVHILFLYPSCTFVYFTIFALTVTITVSAYEERFSDFNNISILAYISLQAVPHAPPHLWRYSCTTSDCTVRRLFAWDLPGFRHGKALGHHGCRCDRGALNPYCDLNSHGSMWDGWELVVCLVSCSGCSLRPGLHAPILWWPCRGRGRSSGLLPNCCLLDACWSEIHGSRLQWCNWRTVAHSFMPYTLEIHFTSVCGWEKPEVFFTQ